MTVDRSHLQCGIRQSRTKCGALRLAAATLFLLAVIPTSSLGPGGSSVTFGPYSLRLHAIKLRRSSLKFAGQALVLRGGDRASGGDNDGQDKMGDSGGSEMDPFDAGEMGGGKSMFPAEDDTKGLTVAEVDALNQVGEGGGIVFLRKGLHNITAGGEIEFQQPLHIAGQNGAQIVAAAQPRPKGSLYPVVGGGRLRLSSVALGSTFSGLTWLNDNVHCVVLERSAALFEACELRCAAGAYVSCIWAAGGSHVSLSRCTVGGFSHERQCTNALLLSASTGALDGSKMEFCFSATVAVNDNSTLRASACALLDSYAALSLTDSVLRQDELETPIEGDVTLLNCTVRTLEFWRGTERPRRFVDEGRINYEMEIHDADHIIEAIETRPTGVVAYDSDKGLWVYQGAHPRPTCLQAA